MDYYTVISRDNNILVEEILEEVSVRNLKSLGNWDDCYNIGVDGYLVNIVYNIIKEEDVYKKEEIDTRFDEILQPIYKKTTRLSDKQFYDIFNTIWTRIFQEKPLEYRFIKTIASYNQPTWRRILNSNGFMIFSSLLLLASSAILGGTGYFISMLFILFFGSISIETIGIAKTYIATFIIGCIIAFFFNILESDNNTIIFNECFLASYSLSLLMIPVLIINNERLKEFESKTEKYYKKYNNVK